MTDFNLGAAIIKSGAIDSLSKIAKKKKGSLLREHNERIRQTVEKEKEEEKKMTEAGVSRREITEKKKNRFVFRGTSGGGGREKVLRTRFREDGKQGKEGKARYQKPQEGQTFFEEKIEEKEENKMYRDSRDNRDSRRSLRPEDTRSAVLEKAAEQMVEGKAMPKGKESQEYKDAKNEFDRVLGIQRISSPKTFSIKETRRTAFSVQSEVIRGEINEDVLRVIARAIKMEYLLVPIAVAVRDVRMELINKGVSLAKEGVTDRADPQSLERLLIALRKNGLEKELEYLAGNMSHKWLQKMEVRAARKLILDRKPELANWLPELPLTRESKLTREYVGRLLGALKAVGDTYYYRTLSRSVEEGWRLPIKPKVVTPSEKEKGTVKEKPVLREEPTVKKKDEKSKDKSALVVKKVPEKKGDELVKGKVDKGGEKVAPGIKDTTNVVDDNEMSVDELKKLSVLARKSLKDEGLETVGDLRKAPWKRIKGTPNVGPKSLKILESVVKVKK